MTEDKKANGAEPSSEATDPAELTMEQLDQTAGGQGAGPDGRPSRADTVSRLAILDIHAKKCAGM